MENKSEETPKGPKHIPIFPTNVFELDVEESEDLNDSLFDALQKIKNPSGLPNWSTQNTLHMSEDFEKFKKCALESVRHALDFLSFQYDDVSLTSLTAHTVTEADRSPPEVYSNNVFSGIYCLKAGGGRVILNDPRMQAWAIRPNITNVNVFNSDVFVMELHEGKMIVIPSWLQRFMVFPPEETEENVYFTWTAMLQG